MKVVYNTAFGGFGISRECAEWLADRGNLEALRMLEATEFYGGSLCETERHDALLVMAVEELGSTKASGEYASLELHKLKGDRYFIDEYDGAETVVEPSNITWIVV